MKRNYINIIFVLLAVLLVSTSFVLADILSDEAREIVDYIESTRNKIYPADSLSTAQLDNRITDVKNEFPDSRYNSALMQVYNYYSNPSSDDISTDVEVFSYIVETGKFSDTYSGLYHYANNLGDDSTISAEDFASFWDYASNKEEDISNYDVTTIRLGYESLDKAGSGWGLSDDVSSDLRESYESGDFIERIANDLSKQYTEAATYEEKSIIIDELNSLKNFASNTWNPDTRDIDKERTDATKFIENLVLSEPTIVHDASDTVNYASHFDDVVAIAEENNIPIGELPTNPEEQNELKLILVEKITLAQKPDVPEEETNTGDSTLLDNPVVVTGMSREGAETETVIFKPEEIELTDTYPNFAKIDTEYLGSSWESDLLPFLVAGGVISEDEKAEIIKKGVTGSGMYEELDSLLQKKHDSDKTPYEGAAELLADLDSEDKYVYVPKATDDQKAANDILLAALNSQTTEEVVVGEKITDEDKKEVINDPAIPDVINTDVDRAKNLLLAKDLGIENADGLSDEQLIAQITSKVTSLSDKQLDEIKTDSSEAMSKLITAYAQAGSTEEDSKDNTNNADALNVIQQAEGIKKDGADQTKIELNFVNGELQTEGLEADDVIYYTNPYSGQTEFVYASKTGNNLDLQVYDAIVLDKKDPDAVGAKKYIETGSSRGAITEGGEVYYDESTLWLADEIDYKLTDDKYILLGEEDGNFVFTSESNFLKDPENPKPVDLGNTDAANRMLEFVYGDVFNRPAIVTKDGDTNRYIIDTDSDIIYKLGTDGTHETIPSTTIINGLSDLDELSPSNYNSFVDSLTGEESLQYDIYDTTKTNLKNYEASDYSSVEDIDRGTYLLVVDVFDNNNLDSVDEAITAIKDKLIQVNPSTNLEEFQQLNALKLELESFKEDSAKLEALENEINTYLDGNPIEIDDDSYDALAAEIRYEQITRLSNFGQYDKLNGNELNDLELSIDNSDDVKDIVITTTSSGELEVVAHIKDGDKDSYETLIGSDAAQVIFESGQGISLEDEDENKYVVTTDDDGNTVVYSRSDEGTVVLISDAKEAQDIIDANVEVLLEAQKLYAEEEETRLQRIENDRQIAEKYKENFMTGLGDIFHDYMSAYEIEAADAYVEQVCYEGIFVQGLSPFEAAGGGFGSGLIDSWGDNGWLTGEAGGATCSVDETVSKDPKPDSQSNALGDCYTEKEAEYSLAVSGCSDDNCIHIAQDAYYAALDDCKTLTLDSEVPVETAEIMAGMFDGTGIGAFYNWGGTSSASCHPSDNGISTLLDAEIFKSSFGVNLAGKKYNSAAALGIDSCSYLISVKMTSVFPVRLAITLQKNSTSSGNARDNYLYLSGALNRYGVSGVNPNLIFDDYVDENIPLVRAELPVQNMTRYLMNNYLLLQPDPELLAADMAVGNISLFARKYVEANLPCGFEYYCYYAMSNGVELETPYICHRFAGI